MPWARGGERFLAAAGSPQNSAAASPRCAVPAVSGAELAAGQGRDARCPGSCRDRPTAWSPGTGRGGMARLERAVSLLSMPDQSGGPGDHARGLQGLTTGSAMRMPRHRGSPSSRERQLVILVAQGHTDAQIAAQPGISILTVRSRLDRIRDKTGYRRRVGVTPCPQRPAHPALPASLTKVTASRWLPRCPDETGYEAPGASITSHNPPTRNATPAGFRPGAIREHRGIGYYTKKVLTAGPFAEDAQRYFEPQDPMLHRHKGDKHSA
jgi:hypothetical protein